MKARLFQCILVFAFLVPFLSPPARAEGLDYSLGFGTRNLPLAASASAEAGYGKLLWGKDGPGQFLYGYLRPVVRVRSSALVNAGNAELEFAPISFLTFSGGATLSNRWTDTDTIDCTRVDCRGVLGSTYVSASLVAGHGNWATGIDAKLSWMTPWNITGPFADESSALTGAPGGDRLVATDAFFTWKLGPFWRVGGFTSMQHMITSAASNDIEALFARRQSGAWAYTGGWGFYQSSTHPQSLTFFFAISWTGRPSVALQ